MSEADLARILGERDPLAVAAALPPQDEVTVARAPAPETWLVDGDEERPLAEHRAAHAQGRPSEAAVAYGHRVPAEQTARRLLALRALSDETGMLRAACPVPADPPDRPGSWGVEDLTVIAAARLALPEVPWIRPHWRRLGAGACQVALAFGATDLEVPQDERQDLEALVAASGRTAVPR